MHAKVIDVLIVGAGPTGTALAIDLVRRGVQVRIIDKAKTSFEGSRAKGIQPRTLEVLQDLGGLDDVLAVGDDYPLLGIHLGPFVLPWRMIANAPRTSDLPFPRTWLIPQFRTDAALHHRLQSAGVAVEYSRELTDLTEENDSVNASVAGIGGSEQIRALYVVGADGGSSLVRRKLGIEFTGTTREEDRMIIADAVTTGLSRKRWHIWPGRAGRFVGACPLPHGEVFQWMIRLSPDEEARLDLGAINGRIQKRIGDRRVELRDLRWTSVFRPNIRLADNYRRGRIFLAGDAAHVHPPAGAQGLNTGIQDAYNLGWKFGQVLAGADPSLLDTYENERRPIAEAVLSLSTKKYEGIAKLDPSSIRRGKDEKQLALSYRGGPLAPEEAPYTSTLRIGDRAPDADLIDADKTAIRLFHAFVGPHFTAIGFGNRAALAVESLEWPSTGATLKRVSIDAAMSHFADCRFTDRGGSFRRAYGVSADAVLLVRPDGYIGHIATADMHGETQAAVERLTAMACPKPSMEASCQDDEKR